MPSGYLITYSPAVWMFKLIIQLHERTLRIVYQDHNLTFDELIAKDGSFKMQDHNLHKLLIEMFKLKMNLALEIMNEVFNIVEYPYRDRKELRF